MTETDLVFDILSYYTHLSESSLSSGSSLLSYSHISTIFLPGSIPALGLSCFLLLPRGTEQGIDMTLS